MIRAMVLINIGIFSPVSNYLSAKVGDRPVMMAGGILFAVGCSTIAFTTRPWQGLLLYGFIGGIGKAFLYPRYMAIFPRYFDKRLSVTSGIAGSALYIGAAIGSPIIRAILDRFGMEGVAVTFGLAGLLISFLATFLRPSSRYSNSNERADQKHTKRGSVIFSLCRSVRSHPRIIAWCLVMSMFYMLLFTTSVHMVRYAECSLEVESTAASFLMTYLYGSAAVGSVIAGFVGRRMRNPIYLQMGLMIGASILAVCFPLYNSFGTAIFYSVSFGLTSSLAALNPLVVAFIMGGGRLADDGVTLFSFFSGIFGASGPPLAGWMYDIFGNYTYSFVAVGSVTLTAALIEIVIEAVLTDKGNESNPEETPNEKPASVNNSLFLQKFYNVAVETSV